MNEVFLCKVILAKSVKIADWWKNVTPTNFIENTDVARDSISFFSEIGSCELKASFSSLSSACFHPFCIGK